MPGAVHSNLDFSILNAMRARRRATERDAAGKLVVLQRLRRQCTTKTLPRYRETNVEQSWNEQIFAKVLGYQTQFSHDGLPFHVLPKDYANGTYSDFALGFFGIGVDRVLGSAEHKGPLANLEKPQRGSSYKGRTAVEQALETARRRPGCRWALVSNFTEIRLYDAASKGLVASAYLPDITDANQIALLQAHFDRPALLGDDSTEPEIAMALDSGDDHPSRPVAQEDGRYRIISRFTPSPEQELSLFLAEDSLVRSVLRAPPWFRLLDLVSHGSASRFAVAFEDGWVAIDGTSERNDIRTRVALSLFGQVQVSVSLPFETTDRESLSLTWIVVVLRFFAAVVDGIYAKLVRSGGAAPTTGSIVADSDVEQAGLEVGSILDGDGLRNLIGPEAGVAGSAAFEFREIARAGIHAGKFRTEGWPESGSYSKPDLATGDLSWPIGGRAMSLLVADAVSELAVYFRSPSGGVKLDRNAVVENVESRDQADAATAKKEVAHTGYGASF